MHYRMLGDTGLRVSEIGLGGNRLGETNETDAHWVRLIRRAAELGVNIIDTAEAYADTRSETMLGMAIADRQDVYIATKMSGKREGRPGGFGLEAMTAAVEDSLKRLRREVIDVFQLHSPPRAVLDRLDWHKAMLRLREQGKIRFRGMATNNADDAIWLMREGLVDVLQITHNILIDIRGTGVFETAARHAVGLLVRMPLARGTLTGKFASRDGVPEGSRALLDGEKLERRIAKAHDLAPLAAGYPGGLARMAHHFSLTPREVSATIPGARTIEQLEQNVAASNGDGLSASMLDRIAAVQRQWQPEPGWY